MPITEISSSFAEAKEQYGKYGHGFVFDDAESATLDDLAKGKRNVIVGEPGIGKTELMKRLQGVLDASGNETKLISLRSLSAVQDMDAFVTMETDRPKALMLDALDETPLATLSAVLEKVQEISREQPGLAVYISSRWIFMEKYANSFSEYRFIAIKPFTSGQVKDYLVTGGRNETEVEELISRMMQFHGRVIIQIPRYLFLLENFMQGKAASDVYGVSRNELFEHFIYYKLELEAAKSDKAREMVPVIKRLLEKLALVMEIYQTNAITKEELATFFDDLKSDIKLVVLTQVSIDVLLKNSVLQTSATDADKLEFENAEFQEYLAAKEITRFPEPRRAAFSFAADSTLSEIYPSWYNTISFLVDMEPDMLGQLLDFSGIRGEEFKVADEAFFSFLNRVNPAFTPEPAKARLFTDVVSYHNTKLQWMPGQLTSALPGFYSADLENFLKEEIAKAEPQDRSDAKYYVPTGNVAYVVAYLLRSNIEIDRVYWRERLVRYASEPCANGVLPRHALLALSKFGDPTVIEELTGRTQARDELVMREFVAMCAELDPNNPRSVEAFLQRIRANDLHGRYGLFEVTQADALKQFLRAYNKDENLRREFLDDSSIFADKDHKIVDNIRAVADDEMRELAIEAIVQSVHYSVAHTRGKSAFISGLMAFLREGNPGFIPDLIRCIRGTDDGETSLYFAQDFFSDLLSVEDVVPYIDAMLESGEHTKKEDKLESLQFEHVPKKLTKEELLRQLLIVQKIRKQFPNTGTLKNRLSKILDVVDQKSFYRQEENIVALLTSIAYNNPITFPLVAGLISECISKIKKKKQEELINLVRDKMCQLSNCGFLEIWVQRIFIKLGFRLDLKEILCKAIYQNDFKVFETGWIRNKALKNIIDNYDVIDRKKFAKVKPKIEKKEVRVFTPYYN